MIESKIMDTRTIFMGSPDFALPILDELHRLVNVVGVVTQPDRPSGRGRSMQSPPVKILAENLGIPVIQPEKLTDPDAMQKLTEWAPELIVVAAFGQLLKKQVLDMPRLGCLNVHASLLPRWRGASPIQAAILHGDSTTGITIMKMDIGLDNGPILTLREFSITEPITGGDLSRELSILGARTLGEVLPSYINGMIAPYPQDESNATYTKKLKKTDGKLDFNLSAHELASKVLAFNPWPGTFFELEGRFIKVHKAHAHDTFVAEPEGHYIVNDKPAIGTARGLFVLDVVQPASKHSMSGSAYLNGYPRWL
jgi:methionyl-tRNA formyltransferase